MEQLYGVVYDELRRLARAVRRDRAATLDTTALVNEAYLRLAPASDLTIENRLHFFRVAAGAMRFVLVDRARRRSTAKRGGDLQTVTLSGVADRSAVEPEQMVALERALERLEALEPRQARVVECRYFAGLSVEETAAALGVSAPTVKRDWRAARAFLAHELD